jgi:hypothetical protein
MIGAISLETDSTHNTNVSCNICFDDFEVNEEVVRIPCKYVDPRLVLEASHL